MSGWRNSIRSEASAGTDVEAVGFDRDMAAIDDAFGVAFGDERVGGYDISSRALQGVAPFISGGRAGVGGFAIEDDIIGRAPHDPVDDADVQILLVQAFALFDMQFEVAEDGGGIAPGAVQFVEPDAGAVQGGAEGHIVMQSVADIGGGDLADHAVAAEERFPGAFFIGEVDGFQVIARFQAGFVDAAQALQGGQHADSAVKAAAVGDGIEVGADHQGLGVRVRRGQAAAQVADFVVFDMEPGFFNAVGEPGARRQVLVG